MCGDQLLQFVVMVLRTPLSETVTLIYLSGAGSLEDIEIPADGCRLQLKIIQRGCSADKWLFCLSAIIAPMWTVRARRVWRGSSLFLNSQFSPPVVQYFPTESWISASSCCHVFYLVSFIEIAGLPLASSSNITHTARLISFITFGRLQSSI